MARIKVRFEMKITTKDGVCKIFRPIISFRDDPSKPLKERIMEHIRSVEKNKEIGFEITGYQVEGGEIWRKDA